MLNGIGKTLTCSADATRNRTVLVDSDGGYTTYACDAESRITGIVNPWYETTTLSYDALDRETQRVLGNSVAISKSYDAAGRETLISSPVAVYTATYDAVGNRLTVAELDGTLVTYSYDASYQLTREQRSGANAIDESFVYDGLGNRLTKTDTTGITTCTYNAANAQVTSVAPTGVITTSTFDANGNLTLENAGGALTTYTWDGDNHLLTAVAAGNVQTNTYSADGMRFERIVNGTSRRYVRNGENVRGEIKTNGGAAAMHEDLPGIWGAKFAMRSGTSFFYVPDFQGNTRFLLDSAGAVTDTLITDAWGVELARTGSLETPFMAFGQWGYFGDTASRLYVRARHLRVDLGRWVSRDPLSALAAARSPYVVDPLLIDPSGMLTYHADGIHHIVRQDSRNECGRVWCGAGKTAFTLSRDMWGKYGTRNAVISANFSDLASIAYGRAYDGVLCNPGRDSGLRGEMWGIGFYGGGSYIVHAGEHIGGWRPTLPQTWGADRLVQGSAAKVMAARFHTAEWLIENWDAKGDRTARSVPVSKARAATGVTPNQMLMMLVVLKGSGGDRPGTPRNVAQYLVRNGASQGVAWDGGSTTQLAIWPDRIDQHAYATARQPPCFVVLFECCPFRGDKG